MKKIYSVLSALCLSGILSAQCTNTLPANTYTVFSGPSYTITTSTPANIQVCSNAVAGDSTGGAGKKFYIENGGYLEVKPGNNPYTVIVRSGGTFNALGGSSATVYHEMGSIIQNFSGPPLPPCPSISFNYSLLGGNPCLQTGVEEVDKNPLRVFPNPSDGFVSIKCVPGSEISVSDISGRIVAEIKCENDLIKIDLSLFGSGIYFIKSGNTVQKVLVY